LRFRILQSRTEVFPMFEQYGQDCQWGWRVLRNRCGLWILRKCCLRTHRWGTSVRGWSHETRIAFFVLSFSPMFHESNEQGEPNFGGDATALARAKQWWMYYIHHCLIGDGKMDATGNVVSFRCFEGSAGLWVVRHCLFFYVRVSLSDVQWTWNTICHVHCVVCEGHLNLKHRHRYVLHTTCLRRKV
jgi:hypothetical protein